MLQLCQPYLIGPPLRSPAGSSCTPVGFYVSLHNKAVLWLGGQGRPAGELSPPEKLSNDEGGELVGKYLTFLALQACTLRGCLHLLSEASHGIKL